MKEFKTENSKSGDTLKVSFSGEISMQTDLPRLKLEGISEVNLDVGEVTYINSAGVRKWMIWTRELTKISSLKFTLSRIPGVLVKQMSTIENFVPTTSQILSLYVPYYCENCDTNSEKLLERGKHFGAGITSETTVKAMQDMKCPKCGKPMEIDAVPDQYIAIIARHS